MQYVFPDYYSEFKCIKNDCKHNCCIGWEIDIDENTAELYKKIKGKMRMKLKNNISTDDQPHFILNEQKRCPFLNEQNLCDIIIELGDDHLCNICSDHPRFRNELPGRIETGLGLCCEAAASLILGKSTRVGLNITDKSDDEIIKLRDLIISVLQNRQKEIPNRIEDMMKLCHAKLPLQSMYDWINLLLSLERMDEEWANLLIELRDNYEKADVTGFDTYMLNRQSEYEQLLVYFIYRNFANASNLEDAALRAVFAVFGYNLIHAIGAVIWYKKGSFEFETQVEIARMFSSEIEYSDENLDIILSKLDQTYTGKSIYM